MQETGLLTVGSQGLTWAYCTSSPPNIYSQSPTAPYSARDLAPAPVPTQGKTLALHKGVFTEPVKLLNFNPTKKSIFWQWIIDDTG